ncbi:MFS transporter [Nigerium massiliense]|uniref:MFS transporter n=1 Tax=Nigerium massiliense TaxID=1522317 RepID=UPI000B16C345|nr:MFS transporter [Nigerium massiliense]
MTDRNIIRIEGSSREFNRLKILFVLLLPLAMSLMAVSSVNVALPTIETGLGASASDVQWVLSGYALAFGISLVPSGRAGDVLGRGALFIAGLTLFVVASFVCGLASTPLMLNIARIVQGVGAGMFSPQVTGMIQQYFSGAGRARAFALFGLVISASVAVGPIVAGIIIESLGPQLGWRGAFYFNLPLGILGIILALAWFPFARERSLWATKAGDVPAGTPMHVDLDPVGTLLLAISVLCVMLPFMAHDNPWTWLLLGAGALTLWAWYRWEKGYAARGKEPMVDLTLFGYKSFSYGTMVSGVMFTGSATTFVLVALFLQSGLHTSALEAGLIGLPNAIVSAFFSVWAGGRVMSKGRALVIAGLLSIIIGCCVVIGVAELVAHSGISFWWLALALLPHGFGMGVIGSANQTLSLQDIPPAAGGTAGGVKQTAERIGTAIGNAMITGVFFAVLAMTDWTTGFAAGFVVIALVLMVSLFIAWRDFRYHRSIGRA